MSGKVQVIDSGPQIEMSKAVFRICEGRESRYAVDALMMVLSWVIAEAVAESKGPVDISGVVDELAERLKQAVKIQMEQERAGTH